MPRRRPKARIEHLADALEAAQKAGVSLSAIDLRTCTKDIRQLVKDCRAAQEHLVTTVTEAMKADLPVPPGHKDSATG